MLRQKFLEAANNKMIMACVSITKLDTSGTILHLTVLKSATKPIYKSEVWIGLEMREQKLGSHHDIRKVINIYIRKSNKA